MNFVYTATGSIFVGGCSATALAHLFYARFSIGDIVYSRPKARRGVLEKYCIKAIRLFPEREEPNGARVCQICNYPPLYIDTLNAYHNEEDLVGPEGAKELAAAYLKAEREALEAYKLKNC